MLPLFSFLNHCRLVGSPYVSILCYVIGPSFVWSTHCVTQPFRCGLPAFGIGTTKRGEQRLRDWALIELDQKKHSTKLDLLQNRVMAPKWLNSSLQGVVLAEFGISDYHTLLLDDHSNTMPLLGTIPEREIYDGRCQEDCRALDARAIMVLKYGGKTGLTVGLANQVKSVLRFPHEDNPVGELSEEWCIVKVPGQSATTFSQPGDSGACIWDIHGRIGGMISAGLKNVLKPELDITYATPIEWLLEDIQKHGFNIELLGAWAWG